MFGNITSAITNLIGKAIDKAVPDKDEANKLKAEITMAAFESDAKELQGAIDIIVAEANGGSWLQRNWRPITMMTFLVLIVCDSFGLLEYRLAPESWTLLKIGLGGYVMGRSGEKIIKEYKSK